jgi:hypothetical protein
MAANRRARILGAQWERQLACSALPELAGQYGINWVTLVRPQLVRRAADRVGGRGTRKLVQSGAVGRLDRLTLLTATGSAGAPQLCQPNGLACCLSAVKRRRERHVSGEVAGCVVSR